MMGIRGDGAVGLSVRPASGGLGVRIPGATDLIRKRKFVTASLRMIGNWCECHGSSEMTILHVRGCPVSQ